MFCLLTLSSAIGHDHTKECNSRFRKEQSPPLYQINLVIASSRHRSWVGHTTSTEEWPEYFKRQAVIPVEIEFRIPWCFFNCLKGTSALSSSTEGEDELCILLHGGWRHTKCSCILSLVNARAQRTCRNQEQHHQFCERMCEVATTGTKTTADKELLPSNIIVRRRKVFRNSSQEIEKELLMRLAPFASAHGYAK